ncbi:MAG: superoxide dismutase family protein [Kofleriaceae bacterium]|nr:superoxide dismutase family protein [Kofleriaceae bacterium]
MPALRVLPLVLAAGAGCTREVPPAAPTAPAPAPAVPVATLAATSPSKVGDQHPEAVKEPDENVIAAMGMRVIFIDPGADEPEPVDAAIVVLHPTRGSKVGGTLQLREVNGGLDVTANVTGLPRARHAVHVHLFGDCASQNATSTGPHFNFEGSSFRPSGRTIVGDLGNLEAVRGVSTTQLRIEGATLQGKYSVLGRSVVVHAKPNNPRRPPDGAAGERIACGVIGISPAPNTGEDVARK